MLMINTKLFSQRFVFIALFALSYSCNHSEKNTPTKPGHIITINPIQVQNGWGYDIMVDDKVYIHQYCIPAVGGNKVFSNKQDAIKTAKVVVQKILNGKVPSVTKHDLDSLQIAL